MDNKPEFGFQTGYGTGTPDTSVPDQPTFGFQTGYGASASQNYKLPLYQKIANKENALVESLTPQMVKDVGQTLTSRPELQPYGTDQSNQSSSVVGSALQAAGQTLGAPIRVGATIAASPEIVGQGVSELGNEVGYPVAGALAGTAVQMAPYVAGARAGWNAMQQSTNPIVRGLINTPHELNPQYSAQNEAIGISNRMPESSGGKATFQNPYSNTLSTKPPPALQTDTDIQSNLRGAEPLPSNTPLKYPANNEAFVNYADKRLTFGDQLNPQELSDIKYKADNAITSAKQALQSNMADKAAKTLLARASQIRTTANNLLNQVASEKLPGANLPTGTIPTRPGLNTAYGIASNQQALQNFIKGIPKYTGYAGGAMGGLGAAGYGIKKIYDYLAGNE